MRKLTTLFATVAFTTLMASTALAGTWRNGADANQGKWWYDNGDGTYAQNGWQWIDDNNDGLAECYYFDSEGWLYTDTVTPDGCLVNANGAWVENGQVKTKAAATAVGWFDRAGLQKNAQQNVTYDYITTCSNNSALKTIGDLTFYNYKTFQSDASHPAKAGYVWKTVQVTISFNDTNADLYGTSYAYTFQDKNNIDLFKGWEGEERTFILNVNGTDYTECKKSFSLNWNGSKNINGYFSCLVPEGYNGMFIAFFDYGSYTGFNDEPSLVNSLRTANIFFLD